jgi:hypothetical protein
MIKPFSWGVAAGAAAVAIVGLTTGWLVTGGTNSNQVRAAWIDGQATICSSLAQAHRKASGDISDLSDYKAREARDTLAKTFAVALPGHEAADTGVIKACSDMLKTSPS